MRGRMSESTGRTSQPKVRWLATSTSTGLKRREPPERHAAPQHRCDGDYRQERPPRRGSPADSLPCCGDLGTQSQLTSREALRIASAHRGLPGLSGFCGISMPVIGHSIRVSSATMPREPAFRPRRWTAGAIRRPGRRTGGGARRRRAESGRATVETSRSPPSAMRVAPEERETTEHGIRYLLEQLHDAHSVLPS